MSATPNRVGGGEAPADEFTFDVPDVPDGAALWRIARDSRGLDLNSSYAYLLWCRDFAATSVIARHRGDVVGFVTGYRRPASTDTLVVWQVAVDGEQRGRGLAGRLLDDLLDRLVPQGVRFLETTVTEDNTASNRLFQSLAARRRAGIDRTELFGSADFPDQHDAEFRYRIGPL
jgi:L-2,4-diaminobutyric acid acetyltransferase